ncbi:hypothetical protein M0805_007802 [Coniferiporia weirii]|nr:hypothetical protein M0805_007802 [Coniferiporia weirii]
MSSVSYNISYEDMQFYTAIFERIQSQKLSRVSSMIIVLYDIMLTMDKEIEYFWKQRWSTVKLIYMLNRYGGLLFVVIGTWGSFQLYFQQWTGWIPVLLVEIILLIRVNTLYERSRKSSMLLAFFFIVQACVMATALSVFELQTDVFVVTHINSCGTHERPPTWLTIFWLPPIIMDLGLLVLTFKKSLAIRRMIPGSDWRDYELHRILLRDQALYFTGILICSLTNMAFLSLGPNTPLRCAWLCTWISMRHGLTHPAQPSRDCAGKADG